MAGGPPAAQRGIVLASCLVFIVVMTTVALATGGALSVEQRMERNLAESRRTLAAAETALALARTRLGFTPGLNAAGAATTPGDTAGTDGALEAAYRVRYLGFVAVACGSGAADATAVMGWHHFDLSATARTPGAARAVVHQGLAWCAARDADSNSPLPGTPRRTYWWQEDA